MTTPAVQQILADLEAQVRDFETKAGALRSVIASLRAVYGLTPLDSTPPVGLPPAARATPPPPKASRADGHPPNDLHAKILTVLGRLGKPVPIGLVEDKVGGPAYAVRQAIAAMVEDGRIMRTGKTAGTRIGTPAVMKAAAAVAAKEAL